MSLAAGLERALPFLRQQAESRMTSRVTIRRLTGERTPDADGQDVPEWLTVDSDVPFRLGGNRGAQTSRIVRRGETEFEVATRVGNLPVGTPLVDDDLLEITEGECAGLVLRVVEATHRDQATALRCNAYEVSRPREW